MTSRTLIAALKDEIVHDFSLGLGGSALTKGEQTTVWEGGRKLKMRAKSATSEAIEYSWQM